MAPYGFTPSPEPWQWIYLTIIMLATSLLLFSAVKDLWKRGVRCPLVLMLMALVGFLTFLSPYGWGVLFFLNVLLLVSPAPLGASVIAAGFCLGSFLLFMKVEFPWIENVQPR